jgi:hypothetical protein
VVVHPRPWANYVFFVVSTFAALAVALPLVGVPPHPSLLLSAWASVFTLAPALRRARRWPWPRVIGVAAGLGIGAAVLVNELRLVVPPAPLTVARAGLAWSVKNLEPVGPLGSRISVADLHRAGGIVAYTAVYAPESLTQAIVHVWRRNGRIQDVVRLSPVHGGRREGFRTYSRKTEFPPQPVGRWSVDVMTSSGQLIGRLRFTVVE